MKLFIRVLLPVLVLVGAGHLAWVAVANRVEPERRAAPLAIAEVEFITLARSDFKVLVHSRGTVRPRTQSTLVPQVSGRIVEVSPDLRAGGFFEAGNVLLRIDARDYEAEVTVAEATLSQAHATFAEEQARADQAQRDWRRLGESGTPDDLVLRKPQLAGARAARASAQARLQRARLDLERTTIRAPYAGRVLEHDVDVGQVVAPGTTLATIYAVDYVEVRLPLANRQLEFVQVPEIFRREDVPDAASGPALRLSARVGNTTHTWHGRVVRAEGAIDTSSRQLFVVGQVDDPYGKGPEGRPPLKVGQFVEAEIEGRELREVFVIPRAALRAGSRVLLIDAQDHIRARPVQVVHSDDEHAVIAHGLAAGERLVINALGDGMEGVKVRARAPGTERAPPAQGEGTPRRAARPAS
jgi:RND family efflux transporter MFP subunit